MRPASIARITFAQGNAEALPFPDRSFDAYTIAFGIRNVTHIDRALAEAFRVLKTGGRFLCLEFSEVQVPILDRLYDFHSFEVIPRLGKLAAGDSELLPLSGREHPQVPQPGALCRDDRCRRFRARQLAQSDGRHRRHPLRLEDLSKLSLKPLTRRSCLSHFAATSPSGRGGVARAGWVQLTSPGGRGRERALMRSMARASG